MAIEFTDRYQALGIPYPDPATVCNGDCEGTGMVPIFMDTHLPPPRESEARIINEANPRYVDLWRVAEAKAPSDDGWHFVPCPTCGGTGKEKQQ